MKTSNKILSGIGTFLFLFVLTVLIAIRCNIDTDYPQEELGEMTSKSYDNFQFHEIEIHTGADVFLSQGTPNIRIEAPEKIFEKLEVGAANNKLTIEPKSGTRNLRHGIKAYITVDSLTYLGLFSYSTVRTENPMTVNDLSIFQSGSGDMFLTLEANDLHIQINGSADINLKGSANSLTTTINGSGDIRAMEFPVNIADMSCSGSGNINVNVSEKLDARISGSGDIRYKGTAQVNTNISGSGNVQKAD